MKVLTQRHKGYIQWLGTCFGPFQSLSKSLFFSGKYALIASQSEVFFIDKFRKWPPTAHYVVQKKKTWSTSSSYVIFAWVIWFGSDLSIGTNELSLHKAKDWIQEWLLKQELTHSNAFWFYG